MEEPIYLLFVSTADDAPSMSHPRNLIVAEEDSQATFVEDYVSLDGGAVFCNTVTELVAGDHTVLSHYMIEREHKQAFNISTLRIQQGRSANVVSHSVLLGGALVRNNVHPVLAGEGGECLINGLFIGNGRQHLDNYMLVEHASPRCGSRQFYNGILDGHAHGVFHGRIIVHKDAQKTDAKQTNRNLLLSDDAQIDTKPQLEIYADDVKCTHGATIGQIEEDALFYLRSRGIDEVSARKLLLFAFASECLDRMKQGPVRKHVEGLINQLSVPDGQLCAWCVDREPPRGHRKKLGGNRMTTAAKRLPRESRPPDVRDAGAGFDVEKVRADFPILRQKVRGRALVYLDNAATSQKPQVVIDAIASVLRAGQRQHPSWRAFPFRTCDGRVRSGARGRCNRFLNAADASEIIFVRGATEAINLVAQTYGRAHVHAGDEVLITAMEHHSNIVPWQILCEEKGARLRVAPISDSGELLLEEFENLLGPQTKIVAVTHVSNALGTINPVQRIIEMAHRGNIPVLVDGAQAVPHLKVDVQALDCDFYVFSGHKVYGPTGIGVLYGKSALLDAMPPYQGGGDMISSVTFEKTIYNKLPYKFEAGTPHVAGAIGLGAAIEYVNGLGMDNIAAHEHELLAYATETVSAIPGIRLIGTAKEKAGVLSFLLDSIHPHDIGTILDQEGIAIRTGHHCAQPVMQRFGIAATARASFALYNTREEVDALVEGIQKVREVFA